MEMIAPCTNETRILRWRRWRRSSKSPKAASVQIGSGSGLNLARLIDWWSQISVT